MNVPGGVFEVNPIEVERQLRQQRIEKRSVKPELRGDELLEPKRAGRAPDNFIEPKRAAGAQVDFVATAKSSGALELREVLMMSSGGFVMVIVSSLFMYVGWWLDKRFDMAPTFMLGLLLLGVSLCIWKLYRDALSWRRKRFLTTALPSTP